jgi:hypothetical protein
MHRSATCETHGGNLRALTRQLPLGAPYLTSQNGIFLAYIISKLFGIFCLTNDRGTPTISAHDLPHRRFPRNDMGCTTSCIAPSVAELNKSAKAGDERALLMQLAQTPKLLSTPTSVLSSTGVTPVHQACESKQLKVDELMYYCMSWPHSATCCG